MKAHDVDGQVNDVMLIFIVFLLGILFGVLYVSANPESTHGGWFHKHCVEYER